MRNWTEDQLKVIETAGSSMLVSAAAGSGKTAVLVERIIRKITGDEKADIDRLLVVTFTNAAAGEMRERIRAALETCLEEKPDNEHLVRQLTLVHHAKIMTIHSFCLDVIRNHFHEIAIDPAFRVADEGEMKLLRADVMRALAEEEYAEGGMRFQRFVDAFARGTSDEPAQSLISRFYDFSRSDPFPAKWRQKCLEAYDPMSEEELEKTDWICRMVEDTKSRIRELKRVAQRALDLTRESDGPSQYETMLAEDVQMVEQLTNCVTYAQLQQALSGLSFTALSRKKNPDCSEDKKERVKALRESVKKTLKDLADSYFAKSPAQIIAEAAQVREIAAELVRLTDRFDEALSQAKKDRNIVDFEDLEHMALEILVRDEADGPVPTETAKEYAGMFDEIMTDEYQDSNMVQEILLESVAGGDGSLHNRFMVGDVKQSIYRFRQARPQLFLEKYNRYSKESGEEIRIDLHKNFRSRPEVLDSVNRIFERAMIEQVGGIIYDEDARLNPGAAYPEGNAAFLQTEITLVTGDETGSGRARAEAKVVADRIKEIVGKEQVWDAGADAFRPAAFGDIVILLRSMSGDAEIFVQSLSDEGIPVYTGTGSGYFSTLEVRTVLSYLSVIDNPRQDIPLTAALRSPIGGLSDSELARIRCVSRESDYYTAARRYMEQEEDMTAHKLRAFFAMTERFRDMAPALPISELIWRVLRTTGYTDYVRAMPAGVQRGANLDMLIERAMTFEQGAFKGLFNFIRYIENLKTYEIDYGEAPISGGADAVRIMTIHKSKGLEFPIVFVSRSGSSFNRSDERSAVILHSDLGIGCDVLDPVLKTRTPGLMKNVLRSVNRNESLGEELRVLYVALTRAKEKLVITGYVPDLEKTEEKWEMNAAPSDETLSYLTVEGAGNFLDWIMPAVYSGDNPGFFRTQVVSQSAQEKEQEEQSAERIMPDMSITYDAHTEEIFAKLREDAYPFESSGEVPGKMSVSELKIMGHEADEEAHDLFPPVRTVVPSFIGGDQVGGAQRGTVYHRVLECFDYGVSFEGAFVEAQLESMADCGKIARDDLKLVDPARIERFVTSELGERMRRAHENGCLYRESPFVMGVKADTVRPQWPESETVLVQGIIDAWFEESGEIVIVDYKTDRIPDGQGGEYLADKYGVQLAYYSSALEKLTGKRVKERLIYSLRLSQTIPV